MIFASSRDAEIYPVLPRALMTRAGADKKYRKFDSLITFHKVTKNANLHCPLNISLEMKNLSFILLILIVKT